MKPHGTTTMTRTRLLMLTTLAALILTVNAYATDLLPSWNDGSGKRNENHGFEDALRSLHPALTVNPVGWLDLKDSPDHTRRGLKHYPALLWPAGGVFR